MLNRDGNGSKQSESGRQAGGSSDAPGWGPARQPEVTEQAHDPTPGRPAQIRRSAADRAAPPPKILVVDDEAPIRFFLVALLQRDGYTVTAAESGERALVLIASQSFDLVIIDLRLGDMGGLQLLASLQSQAPGMAVIILTGHGSMETAIEALRHGADDYLLKPCEARVLRQSVSCALEKRRQAQGQRALLRQVEDSLSASLNEIRTAVLSPPSVMQPAPGEMNAQAACILQQGRVVVDLARRLISLDGHTLGLTRTEFDLLAYLIQRAPDVVSAQELVLNVQGYECDRFEAGQIVRHLVYCVRRKAKTCAGCTQIIRTVRGVGYASIGGQGLVREDDALGGAQDAVEAEHVVNHCSAL